MALHIHIEDFAADDPRMADFEAVRARAQPGAPPEPVPADARCLLASVGAQPLARATVATAEDVQGAAGITGIVGHYEAVDGRAGVDVLRRACTVLAAAGAARVLGPMNGSTWGRYRLALPPEEGGTGEPPFAGEPWNPPDYPQHWERAGFTVAATYLSAVARDLATPHPRRAALEKGVAAAGVAVRPLDPAGFDEAMHEIFELSARAFAGNLFYAPISAREFRAMYEPLRPLLDPELVRLAHARDGSLAGFVLAYPDFLTKAPGAPGGRLVLKTLATAEGARGIGLGSLLTDEVRRLAHERGFDCVIHALMHEENDSTRISRHTAEVFRRYALYGWTP
jgi:ribosomal protein S18 acetylase RimI-like enzyme